MTLSQPFRRLLWIVPTLAGMILVIRFLDFIENPGSVLPYWRGAVTVVLGGWLLLAASQGVVSYFARRRAGQLTLTVPLKDPKLFLIVGLPIIAFDIALFAYAPSLGGMNSILIWTTFLVSQVRGSKLEVWTEGIQMNGPFFRWTELESASWEVSESPSGKLIASLGIFEPRHSVSKLRLETRKKSMLSDPRSLAIPAGYREDIDAALKRAGLPVLSA